MTAPEAKATDADTAPLTMSAMDMQKRLTELGYKPGPVDGKPGPRTTNALKKFQHDHKLAVTGTLDEETIRALQKP
jgi:peptidoglycan hydrolase-like protein with peptidoglycan-binding domain